MHACRYCGEEKATGRSHCPECDKPYERTKDGSGPRTDCLACQGTMRRRGVMPIRTHGPEEGFFRLFRAMQETQEKLWKLVVYRCKDCGRLEFYEDV